MTFSEILPSSSTVQRFSRVFFSRGLVVFGVIVILIFIMTAIFAPVIAPYSPYKQDLKQSLLKPCKAHLLGTDVHGRDILSRIIFGTRTSLMIGVVAIFIAAFVGMSLGLIAGYFGGLRQVIIMRVIDALMAFPMIILALVVAAVLGGGLKNVMAALAVGLLPAYTRVMCGQVISIKENDYVTAGRAIGASDKRIMLRHIVPNCFPPLIVLITMMMGMTILVEAGLSFLGIGIEPPIAAWGSMVSEGYIMIVVFAFNMVGDGLRDALDPRLKGII
ncbi:MAG: ABC transporter permease [Deltaproteobacteria bacterium]|nr:ABC transporter permease [Deltaproteobacteria bacterium]